jgi:hypothetical protein
MTESRKIRGIIGNAIVSAFVSAATCEVSVPLDKAGAINMAVVCEQ